MSGVALRIKTTVVNTVEMKNRDVSGREYAFIYQNSETSDQSEVEITVGVKTETYQDVGTLVE